ncbi:Imm12 family immunity protein [Ulvibacter litoralis]|uniref:Immunity protein 12 n=1 Tax=Ulvibacter litoralis TaxID=227084 RepID=A0A1G7HE41_9FLAO|nr:Imm12 family immunity protein [Ulvibacter litoralis]GHC57494.1 hypothetical protein GCM10008083_22570 [Ulvibacter litoralis]SDE98742.1 Immunity protein 12 [Ulvibacter litoralis]
MEVTLTSQIGGLDAGEVFRPINIQLRRSLKLITDNYSEIIDHFKLQMRVSGSVTVYKEDTGVHYLRVMKKLKYISGEIILGKEVWENKTNTEIVISVSEYVVLLFENLIAKLKQQQIDIDGVRLLDDVNNIVIKDFMKKLL